MDRINPLTPAGVLTIDTPARTLKFRYPDTDCMKNLTIGVLAGRAYPIIDLPGYHPHTILDIGANIGAAALFFHLRYPSAQILCYEPSPHNIAYLEKNTDGIENIHIHPYGLYDKTVALPLFVGKDTSAQRSIVKNNETCETSEPVQLVSIYEEINNLHTDNLSIVKIDTEGCEVPILYGIHEHLDHVKLLYLEYHSERDRIEIDRLLSDTFYLMNARSRDIHRGALLYVSKSLASVYSNLTQMEITRPSF